MKFKYVCLFAFACLFSGCVYVDDYQETWRVRYGVADQDELKKEGLEFHVSLPDVNERRVDGNSYTQLFHTYHRRHEGPNRVRVSVTQLEPGRYNELHIHSITVKEWTEGKTHTVKDLDSPTVKIAFPNDDKSARSEVSFTSENSFDPVCLDKRQMQVIVDFSVTFGTNDYGVRYYRKQMPCFAIGAIRKHNGLELAD